MGSKLTTYNLLPKVRIGKRWRRRSPGQAVVEYALFVGAVCAALILVLYSARGKFSAVIRDISKTADIRVGE